MKSKIFSIIFGSCLSAALLLPASASADTGTITNSPAYAWGEYLGWLNFATDEGNVVITDSGLSGYVWSQTSSWLNLNPGGDFGGVTNDGDGNLGGFAWSSVYGPVSFTGISISEDGQFEGTSDGAGAGAVAGRITFDCDECEVTTDWSSGGSSSSGSSGGSSGGRRPATPPSPSQPPLVPTTPPPTPSNPPPEAPGLPTQPDQPLPGNSDATNNSNNGVTADLTSSDTNTNTSGNTPGDRPSFLSFFAVLLEPRALAVLGGAGVLIVGYFVFRLGIGRG